ncbi:Uncharacterized protein BM_BM14739 [Brugia malayi]|uniref:Bm14739 n=1 Tax=Brugia malayi TaxID=6279 RepID=A0A0J9XNX9_BRUMA|nr:Uncharacterized protein BM_BM14739 [Brugia malayi]CDP92005.1 Bm14739 [Brugia malayi]VIO88229.1 Uncharacterized protein BM_BM14739 [Brugia malayi]
MDDCTAAIFHDLFRELHIVCTFRHQIRPKTAISIEAHMVFGRPYYIVYGLCEKGSLVQYLEMNTIDLNNGIKQFRTKEVDPNKLPNKRWLAPEVLTTKLLTLKSNVFAFAFLMYEFSMMKISHEAIEDKNILEYIDKNPLFDQYNINSSTLLRKLVNGCWTTNPEKRSKTSLLLSKQKNNH